MITKRHLFIMVSIFVFLGCAHLESYLDIIKSRDISKEYLTSLDAFTRSKTVYSEFETRATIKATYKTPEFNETYFKEYARLYGLTEEEKKKRQDVQAQIDSDYSEFLFYAYTPDKEANDFDRARSIWKVYILYDNGKRLTPVEIRKIDKITPVHSTFYPYINPHHGFFYTVKFSPPIQRDMPFKLVFASVIAKVELDWK